MRSLLVTLADSVATLDLAKAASADVIIIDLGEPAESHLRAAVRRRAAAFLETSQRGAGVFVRVAPLASDLIGDDLEAIVPGRPDGVLLPASTGGADVDRLSAMLRPREALAGMADGAIAVIAMTSTPAGVFGLATYGGASPRLIGLTWSEASLAATVGAEASRAADGALTDLPRLARTLTLAAAADRGIAAIDGLFTDATDLAGLEGEAIAARRDGFCAKLAVNAGQIAVINRAFKAKPVTST